MLAFSLLHFQISNSEVNFVLLKAAPLETKSIAIMKFYPARAPAGDIASYRMITFRCLEQIDRWARIKVFTRGKERTSMVRWTNRWDCNRVLIRNRGRHNQHASMQARDFDSAPELADRWSTILLNVWLMNFADDYWPVDSNIRDGIQHQFWRIQFGGVISTYWFYVHGNLIGTYCSLDYSRTKYTNWIIFTFVNYLDRCKINPKICY